MENRRRLNPVIIRSTHLFQAADVAETAWALLRRFQNISYVEDLICEKHLITHKQRPNARKQATQIRYCLLQAKEYFDAGNTVSLATRPNLYYYCIMSLALAEILFKQTGESSLDRAREQHRHHGLLLTVDSVPVGKTDLITTSSQLGAVPARDHKGCGVGTFELWHRSAREMSLLGQVITTHLTGTTTTTSEILLQASDSRLPTIPKNGLTLLDCFQSLPCMLGFMPFHGVNSDIVRARYDLTRSTTEDVRQHALTIHPGGPIDEFRNNLLFAAEGVDRLYYREALSGGIVQWSDDRINGILRLNAPPGSMWNSEEIRFWPRAMPLNEFGYFYVSLYIAGNYARYYPDKWLSDVEHSSALALAIEELLARAYSLMPLLTLSELTSTYHVQRA